MHYQQARRAVDQFGLPTDLADEDRVAQSWDFKKNLAPAVSWERNARQRGLRDDLHSELETLLGRSFGKYGVAVTFLGFADGTDFLPADKRRQMRELETRFRQLSAPLESERATGLWDADDAARLAELRRQQQAELAQLLSPEEADEYLYRESPAAQYVRTRLPQASSEAEFRALVRVAAELDMDHLKALQPTLESRFAELERALTGTPEEKQRQMETAMKAELEKQAVEILGDQGREFVRRLVEEQF